ncbi:MAG: L-histidine N(alpha)-methyltransferase [Rubrobacter sp.]|nr:L-histidine N(alpha)-methyltransferase [Rubrobacter sp.]
MDKDTFDITTLDNEGGDEKEDMARDIKNGLLSKPKDISPWPKYLYDDEGSRLFEEITDLPEYYQTRTEFSILEAKAAEIIKRSGVREIVELGSGSSTKTRALLEAMLEASEGNDARYSPLDVSEGILVESGEKLNEEYDGLDVHGYVGDFDGSMEEVLTDRDDGEAGSRLVLFLGGTIGNFTPEKRGEFLREIRSGLAPGDHLLVGMDLVKDKNTLEAAYDDSAGVTAKFNKNILNVLNDKLGADFDANHFEHRATYNEAEQRIEMWLDSSVDHSVHINDLRLEIIFEAGEGMRTEMSHKFTEESARRTFGGAGLELVEMYTGEEGMFALALAGVDGSR